MSPETTQTVDQLGSWSSSATVPSASPQAPPEYRDNPGFPSTMFRSEHRRCVSVMVAVSCSVFHVCPGPVHDQVLCLLKDSTDPHRVFQLTFSIQKVKTMNL